MRVVLAALAFLAAGAGSAAARPLPLLAPAPELSIDSDLPPAVRARLEREQRDLAGRAQAAARIQPTTARGCERFDVRGAPGGLGPPAPQVLRRNVLGHHVEVVFGFRTLPQSPACRPWLLTVVTADERTPPALFAVPRSSRCPSLTTCVVTYVDPAFPASPYRVRYRIAGEQLPGCWMGLRQGVMDPLPFPDAAVGRLELAACASWM